MKVASGFVKRHAKNLAAIVMICGAYSFARLPALPPGERALLASHFGFAKVSLPDLPGYPKKRLRAVHPGLEHIASWISSVGASVALNDLDGDGLPNDVVYVDTTINQVIVAQVIETPPRYKPFALDLETLAYDPETMAPMGCLPGDFNEDGLTDIMVYYWGRTPVMFLRNRSAASDGQVSLAENLYTECELVTGQERWYTNAATQADLDGDGHIDLIIGNYFPDESAILDATATGSEQMQHSMSRARNGGRNRFLLWSDVAVQATKAMAMVPRFKNIEGVLGDDLACGWTLGVGAADLDGVLLPEVYFANDFGPDLLIHNLSTPGHLRFEPLIGVKTISTPGSKVLGRDSFKGMGVDFADLNGDGLLDIYVSNIADEYALEESHFLWLSTGRSDLMKDGTAPYVDRGEDLGLSRSGWGWDARLSDFDNDGILEALQATGFLKGEVNRWPELHELAMSNDQLLQDPKCWPNFLPGDDLSGGGHNPFFVRAQDGRYYDLAHEIGIDDNQVSRGIAIADADGDGRLDFAVANQWDSSRFYHNESRNTGLYLGLRLLLPLGKDKPETTLFGAGRAASRASGRPAIGASATVYLPDGRRLVSQVDGGNGHSGKRSPDLHFGLGNISADTQLRVDLLWRSSGGEVSRKTLYLSPGWQTVLLGS